MQRKISPHVPIIAPITAPARAPELSDALRDEQELQEYEFSRGYDSTTYFYPEVFEEDEQ